MRSAAARLRAGHLQRRSTARSKQRILPLARERGIARDRQPAVPRGRADARARSAIRCPAGPPRSAARAGRRSLLKFIVSHPAVTCAIPATSSVAHVRENMGAAAGPPARRGACARAWSRMSRSSDVGVVDLPAVRLPAVLAAHLLPPVRALQLASLAGAAPGARARPRGPGACGCVAARGRAARSPPSSPPAGCGSRGPTCWCATTRSTGRQLFRASRFAIEALLLVWTGVVRNRLRCARPATSAGAAGLCIFVFALLARPLIGPLLGRPWLQAEIFGLAPDPTVVATLGVLVAADRTRWELLVVPLLWCAISGATLWTMQSPDALLMPAAALLALVLAGWKAIARRRQVLPA